MDRAEIRIWGKIDDSDFDPVPEKDEQGIAFKKIRRQ